MSLSMVECKAYAYTGFIEAIIAYDVFEFDGQLERINHICLKMGGFCAGDKPKFVRQVDKLFKEIDMLTTDKEKQNKLHSYAKRIIAVGRNYLSVA